MVLSSLHQSLSPGRFETIRVLKKLNAASRELAELKATSYADLPVPSGLPAPQARIRRYREK
jgi:hypothetical protein